MAIDDTLTGPAGHTRQSALRFAIRMDNDLQRGFVGFVGVKSQEVIVKVKGVCDQHVNLAFPGPHILDGTREIVHLATYTDILLVVVVEIVQEFCRIFDMYL
jgi:hypothetical protein